MSGLAAAIRSPHDLAPMIDHTLLREGASAAEVERLCEEAKAFGFAGACVRPEHLGLAVARLAGSAVIPVVVADFPRGDGQPAAREAEVRAAAAAGAGEIDAVVRLPTLIAGDLGAVQRDLETLVQAAAPSRLKVILETAALARDQVVAGARIAAAAGAAFVKTSTGFGPGGATEEVVRLLRETVGPLVGVKASGGIRTAASALRMVRAGANRIGTSSGVAIVSETSF